MTLFVETEKTTPYFVPNRFFSSVFAAKRGWGGGVYEQVVTVIMVMTYYLMDKKHKR